MEQIFVNRFLPELELTKIDVAEENVRKTNTRAGLDDLKKSIETLGLINPVVVILQANRYKLIVGQRRYMAFRELNRTTIPALVINNIDTKTREIMSLGENIHRVALPYKDTIATCESLYNMYEGTKTKKVNTIAQDLGLGRSTVLKYLAHRLVPDNVKDLVEARKLSQDNAYRITVAFWPDIQKITSIAKNAVRMTRSETNRTIDLGKNKPDLSAGALLKEAKTPRQTYEIVIPIDPAKHRQLEEIAKARNTDIMNLVMVLIDSLLEEEHPLD